VLDVAVFDDLGNPWSPVAFAGTTGYSLSSYLGPSVALALGTEPADGTELVPTTDLAIGVRAFVAGTGGDGVNSRANPSLDSGIVEVVAEGVPVWIAAGPRIDADGDAWFQVANGNTLGWIYSGYLSASEVDAGTGAAIVAEALAYEGVPYLWAGTTPDGFDCSGFTWYILNQVLANSFPRPMEEQIISGTYVEPEDLLPGDLVFFQNTYQWGLSHVGFYLGDGLFVNAGSEHNGVGVSRLSDPYWQARYVTARRVR
jgi:cell wall-associated NlpC family hydrolase